MSTPVTGFSKLSKQEKVNWLVATYFKGNISSGLVLEQYWSKYEQLQDLHDSFSENTVSNYFVPFGIAPNFLINDQLYAIPMAVEESSVVAAASKAAKFWLDRGGFKATVLGTLKSGQVHITYAGASNDMVGFFAFAKAELLQSIATINASMEKRGGGIQSLELVDKTDALEGYYQLHATFETLNAMGANFINTTLEQLASTFRKLAVIYDGFETEQPEVIMSILSNFVPGCTVHVQVSCPVDDIGSVNGVSGRDFARKFVQAVQIATVESYRAVTHNKGIMNGIDAVVLATGNDFRAVEAGVHAYAARDGHYRSLTQARVEDDQFIFEATFPLALGTVGGMTSLHPLSKIAMELLGNPNAADLMKITAVAGLAQNFAAIHSLVTTGIQVGHMKMHINNMLEQIGVNPTEKDTLKKEYATKTPSFASLKQSLAQLRAK
jgi:hydroxymethylglutaryl-CoA reductase